MMDGAKATDKKVEDGKKKRFVPPTVIVYWDLEAAGFRSFRKDFAASKAAMAWLARIR